MRHPARLLLFSLSAASVLGGSVTHAQVTTPASNGDRVLGLDVSAWQGNISQTTWDNIQDPLVENRQFVFIRSSRGGTTGFYDQTDADNSNNLNTLSQRYDDPYFVQNITRATATGMLAGPYHFGRMDIIATTKNANGIPNNGTDEANHFLQMAGSWMRPGYLLPVFDLESGEVERTENQLAQFAIDFSNRIFEVKGIRPAVYINGNYATYIEGATAPLPTNVVNAMPTLWTARWPNGHDPFTGNVQQDHPGTSIPSVYGRWDNVQGPHPWKVWQYTSVGRLNSFNNGNSNLDLDVAHGNIEYLKDMQVPALWVKKDANNVPIDGLWADMINWNSGQPHVAPVYGPGQVAQVGSGSTTPRRPTGEDNVDLNVPTANVTVTLATGTQNIRRLNLNERLNVTGGSLNARLTGQVGSGGTLSISGGTVTFTEGYVNGTGVLEFAGPGTLNVGTLFLSTNPVFTAGSGTAVIGAKSGVASPLLDLMGGTRTFNIPTGASPIVALPLSNGTLTKSGDGTLTLAGSNTTIAGSAAVNVNRGQLLLTASSSQLGINGIVQNQTDAATDFGGTVRLSGNGLSYNVPLTIHGPGTAPGTTNSGALENVDGNNTWSGTISLGGTQTSINNALLNQIYSSGGALTLSGVIQKKAGVVNPVAWAKTGDGDVVLTGAAPNTYDGVTRIFGGRLIIEKDGALGAAGSNTDATGNTFQLADVASTIAFRAPSGSPGLNYNTNEWIFTSGTGTGIGQDAQVQIDNLDGDNVFAGHLGLGGPVVGGTQQAYLGVSADSLEIKGGIYARSTSGPQARNIFKRGAGTLILSGDSSGTPQNDGQNGGQAGALVNSTFTIQAGTVQLKGTAGNTANLPGVTSWNVNSNAALALARTGAAGGAAVNLVGGTLRTDAALNVSNAVTFGTGGGTINSNGFDSSFTGNVSGAGGLTKTGSGRVTFAGAVNNFAGALAVNQGMLALAQSGADSAVANVNGISILNGAKLDLADNDLIVRLTAASAVEAMVAAGFNDGDWNGTSGIISSTAQAEAWLHTLGVADNASLQLDDYRGHTGLTHAETFVQYTIFGDADLTGVVNGADFLRFQIGFAGTNDVWTFGDFDYSGLVDERDFQLYVFGLRNQPDFVIPSELYEDLTEFAVENGFDTSVIPEPSGLSLLALAAGLLLRRRRRA